MGKEKGEVSISTARKKITPQEYSKQLKCLELANIVLKDIKVTLKTHELTGRNTYHFDEKTELLILDEKSALVEVAYSIKAKSGRKIVADMKAKYLVGFTTSKKLSNEFFVLYNHYSLPIQTFPYFRECVHSLFNRMGLPPLLLPLRKFLLADSK